MKLKFWESEQGAASSAPVAVRLPQWSQPYDVEPLKRRLAQLPPDDALHGLLLGYFDAAIVGHAGLKVAPDMANQLAGKLNALDELRTDFAHLWHVAHQPPEKEKP